MLNINDDNYLLMKKEFAFFKLFNSLKDMNEIQDIK
jgi:hypothetical protein